MVNGGEELVIQDRIIVANTGGDTLTLINSNDPYRKETISLYNLISKEGKKTFFLENYQLGPWDLMINKEGLIYSVNAYDNSVFKIDMDNRTILDSIKVGRFPTCIKSFNDNVFISNSDSNSISVIDENDFSLMENIPVGEKPTDIQIDKNYYKVYVANSNGYSIDILDLKRENVETIKLNKHPVKLVLEEDKIFVLCYVNNGVINYSNLSVIELEGYKTVLSIELKGIFTSLIKITGKDIFYLSNIEDGCLYKIDLSNENNIKRLHLGGMPNNMYWDGKSKLYITNILDSLLTIFDTNNQKILNNIKVGKEPNGLLLL